MRVGEKASSHEVLSARERYVPRGIAAADLVVARAWGARIWDADGREYLDFAGGIACQNLGHGPAGVVPGVVVFDRAFHGRTTLTMAMTSKLVYKQSFGPLAPAVYRAPAPYPYRAVT